METKRIYYIDGLKGLAALSVFSWHFTLSTGHIYMPMNELCNNPITKFLIDGGLAVCMFILLSGFSNSLSMAKKPITISNTKDTIVKRYLRIAVPIAPILIIIFLMRCLGLMQNYEFAEWASWERATDCYNASTMNYSLPFRLLKAILVSPLGDTTGVELPTWMLRYILLGSYIILMLHILTHDMKAKTEIGISVFVMFLGGYMLNLYYIPMIAGFLLFTLYPFMQKSKYKHIISIVSLALAIAFYYFFPRLKFPLNGILTAIFLFITIITNPYLQKLLSLGLFKELGRISFMIYLVHMPIICSFSHFLFMHLPIKNIDVLSLVVFIITTIVVIVVAYFATVWIEEKWSKRIINISLKRIHQRNETNG